MRNVFEPRIFLLHEEIPEQRVGTPCVIEEQIKIAVVVNVDPARVLIVPEINGLHSAARIGIPIVQLHLHGHIGERPIPVVLP